MKKYVLLFIGIMAFSQIGFAAITIPGADGSDGVLDLTSETKVIDLAQAVTGNWDDDNTANAGLGIYDSNKWAVVFKYSSVTIDTFSSVTFSNHPSRAPVVWLVNGDVTINGDISLNGQNTLRAPALAEPGPGGFRGGMGYYSAGVDTSAGFGPGGGSTDQNRGYGASHATTVLNSPPPYGNPSLVPLLGGSGGGGADYGDGGGAGGGAILIACTGTLTLNGKIEANGGGGHNQAYSTHGDSGGGSGGGIRLVADSFIGSGTIEAKAGEGSEYPGAIGRTRLERVNNNNTWTVIAPTPSVVGLATNDIAVLWPTATAPTATILSVGGEAVSGDPLASFGTYGADVSVAETNTFEVVIETEYVEQASEVKVRLTPRSNANYTEVDATLDQIVTSDPLVIRWTADVPVSAGYAAVQVHVIRP